MSLGDAIATDPLQTVGVVVAILSIATAIILFNKSRKIKSFSYSILARAPLLTVAEELRGKIKIYYEESPNIEIKIKEGSLFILKFVNDGNVSIKLDDFVRSTSISFPPDVRILSAEIIETNPATLKPELDLTANEIILKPLLLNERDSLTIKALLTGFKDDTEISINSRIVDVREIKNLKSKKNYLNKITSSARQGLIGSLFVIIIGIVIFALFSPLHISVTPDHATASIGGETDATIFVEQPATLVQVIDQIIGKDKISLDAYLVDKYDVPPNIDIIIQPTNFSSVPAMAKMKIQIDPNTKSGIYRIAIRGIRGLETNGKFMFLEVIPSDAVKSA